MRAELNVPWSATLEPIAIGGSVDQLNGQTATLNRLAKLGSARIADAPPPGSAQIVVRGQTYAFPLTDHIDLQAEKARLSKGAVAAEKERDSLAARLSNPNFTERAKPEAVEKARADHDAKVAEAERLRAALERLG
jgi:valyl-tRNA synthetase